MCSTARRILTYRLNEDVTAVKTDLEQFIEDEVLIQRSTAVPVKASLIERLVVRQYATDKLLPNPEDEFCFSDIGPNMNIISQYVSQFIENMKKNLPIMDEPLYVQKIRPSGYMILNGHHRWAAASRLSIKKVPVRVVNGIYEGDVRRILEKSTHEKRATIDLDEVVFTLSDGDKAERRRGIPLYGLSRKRLRYGIPALFSHLKLKGYDIWVYSSRYYSVDDITRFFAKYGVTVDVIITGMKKLSGKPTKQKKKMDELVKNKYRMTLHIDRDLIIATYSHAGDFREEAVECKPDVWSASVCDALIRIENDEKGKLS